ncbi:hypothetical protein I3760_09G134800 [Carya illinoinensis]|nr:hypothetical protein I3760_09G134800 [Carya illinoinensis]KAG2689341.1 hypothetical protein I3760_09G134800 [Carya illinoinensis]KAG2689342.1 hypothetical protein I3760_09G134800 [Carya illinoinensis]KAG2689343.1 hypothetical protein I3760_09G134800 [Carya illinoinensis]KAG2689344.1 hypothetical protein I3760_09G134800 [Carya illinoinensis]
MVSNSALRHIRTEVTPSPNSAPSQSSPPHPNFLLLILCHITLKYCLLHPLFWVSIGRFKLWFDVTMAGVIRKFFIASMFMWAAPVAILYGFNHNLLPGSTQLSPHSLTLVSGFLAVISVNVVIALYVYMAMKEPSDKHEPDPAFLAEAKASVSQSTSQADNSSQPGKKQQ